MKAIVLAIAAALTTLLILSVGLAQNMTEIEDTGTNVSAENIVEVAAADGDFDTLVGAVSAAGLAGTLSGSGPFTLFAPTDEAFDELPGGVLAELTTNESQRGTLRSILTYHVVPGRVLSSDLADGMVLRTVQGTNLRVTVDNDSVMVNGANVVRPDINASNGVIHAIDAVLMPSEVSGAAAEEVVIAEPAVAQPAAAEPAAEEPAETAPMQQTQPGFEGILAIAGILAVAFLGFRRKA